MFNWLRSLLTTRQNLPPISKEFEKQEQFDSHKYDYLHAEDEDQWSYRESCICELCESYRVTHNTLFAEDTPWLDL